MSQVSISSTVYNKAFLSTIWSNRDKLTDYERYGFAQFVYLTFAGHLESFLSKVIENRLFLILHQIESTQFGPVKFRSNDEESICSTTPLVHSLSSLLDSYVTKVKKSQLSKLREQFSEVFGVKLKNIIGPELHQDLDALGDLRNEFAHGRRIFVEFEGFPEGDGTLEGNPLLRPAKRLIHAGILKSIRFPGNKHPQITATFYSDDAILYFRRKVVEIEALIKEHLDFPPEHSLALQTVSPLPELHRGEGELSC